MAPPSSSFLSSLLCFAKLYSCWQTRFRWDFIHKAIFSCARQSPCAMFCAPRGFHLPVSPSRWSSFSIVTTWHPSLQPYITWCYSWTVGKLGTPGPLQPSSELGCEEMLTPHIVCQTPKGGADFSCSSFPILCISDLSLSSCCKVAKKPVQVRQRDYM